MLFADFQPSRLHPAPFRAPARRKFGPHGEPAPFGKGQETLLDTTVRHTWYFPTATVDVDWHGRLDDVLEDARSALDLPIGCRLEAQFHSLLVYERGQFFDVMLKQICQQELGWDEQKWQQEVSRYTSLWQRYYHLPAA